MYAWIIRITAGTCSARCRLSVEDAVCLRFGFINTTTTSLSNYTGARLAVCLASPAAPARPVRPIRWVCLGSSRSRGAETDAQEPLQKIGFPDVLFLSLDNCHKSPSAPVWAHTIVKLEGMELETRNLSLFLCQSCATLKRWAFQCPWRRRRTPRWQSLEDLDLSYRTGFRGSAKPRMLRARLSVLWEDVTIVTEAGSLL